MGGFFRNSHVSSECITNTSQLRKSYWGQRTSRLVHTHTHLHIHNSNIIFPYKWRQEDLLRCGPYTLRSMDTQTRPSNGWLSW